MTTLSAPYHGRIDSDQGKRPYMEDFSSLIGYDHGFVYCIFDGHGGPEVARRLTNDLAGRIINRLQTGMTINHVKNVLVQIFHEQDNTLRWASHCGSTAIVAVKFKGVLYLANVGDSKAIVFDSDGKIIGETRDHKPNFPEEQARILASDGSVDVIGGVARVNGQLAISRSFGDFSLKRRSSNQGPVTATPDIYVYDIQPNGKDHYILMATDGLWDVFTPRDTIAHLWALGWDSQALIDIAINHRMSTDNITVLWAKLQ